MPAELGTVVNIGVGFSPVTAADLFVSLAVEDGPSGIGRATSLEVAGVAGAVVDGATGGGFGAGCGWAPGLAEAGGEALAAAGTTPASLIRASDLGSGGNGTCPNGTGSTGA